jgi:hypothetical protein
METNRTKETRINVQILLQVITASWSRAYGALVMMVLSKGIEESIFDARSNLSAARR